MYQFLIKLTKLRNGHAILAFAILTQAILFDKFVLFQCILHSFADVAISLRAQALHVPLHLLKEMTQAQKTHFEVLGASCHSVEDALEAQALGCTYITAGHVFETDCKKGLPGRGLDFLRNVCAAVDIPVYGIGGIDADNIALVRDAGANGACLMSRLMVSENVTGLMKDMEE